MNLLQLFVFTLVDYSRYPKTLFYKRFTNNLVYYNVLFIKLYQSLVDYAIFPKELNECFAENVDNVSYENTDINQLLLLETITKHKIVLDSPNPIKSGMISVVYKGTVYGEPDKQVIVKMKRIGIYNRLKCDYRKIRRIYDTLYILFYPFTNIINALDTIQCLLDNEEYMLTQCDFMKEINAINIIRQERICDDIHIPIVYNEDNDVIVMEYLDGRSCLEITDIGECVKFAHKQLYTRRHASRKHNLHEKRQRTTENRGY